MEIIFKKSFIKNLLLTPKHIQDNVGKIIKVLESADTLESAPLDAKRMAGQNKNESYYRIKIGDWRIGVKYIKPGVILMTILHRGTIYKKWPPK